MVTDSKIQIPLPNFKGLLSPVVEREITLAITRIVDYFNNKLQIQQDEFNTKLKETTDHFNKVLEDPTGLVNLFATPVIGSSSTDPLLQNLIQNFGSQLIHTVFSAPSGSNGSPSFRLLIASDLPSVPASQLDANATILDVNVINDGELLRRIGATVVSTPLIKNNADSVAPSVTDDRNLGYSVFSLWYDNVAIRMYICEDSTIGAAIWARIDN